MYRGGKIVSNYILYTSIYNEPPENFVMVYMQIYDAVFKYTNRARCYLTQLFLQLSMQF